MRIRSKAPITVLLLISVAIIGQPAKTSNPTQKELKKRRDKWLTVKSWSATYNESYRSLKTWTLRPGVTMKTSIHSTISGTYTLDSLESDGQYYGEWYGFGTGSSVMDQIVTMTSSGPDGEIVITEKTHTASSGAIGGPSNNEYGENWGGSIAIDIYSGTYSAGFGGPDTDGKSTFSRSVQGLPTDYSKLEDLPEGMREIFLPLGEKAEEWATYNGPLEDAQGIMVGGLAGFDLFPDMDEPTEYDLPTSGMQLKGSYSGEKTTKSWSLSPGGKHKPLVLEKTPKEWIPNPERRDPATIRITGNGWNGDKVRMRFTLYEVTNETGFCLNSEDDSTDLDLEFDLYSSSAKFNDPIETEDGWIVETSSEAMNASVDVISLDWGAWGKLKAEAEVDDGVWNMIYCKEGEAYITIPLDERGGIENKIADAFEIDNELSAGIKTMQDDEGSKKIGDGLTAYEEYRGFMIDGDGGKHITTNPENTLDLFVHCESADVRQHISDGSVVASEIVIHLLDSETDYVSKTVRVINPNRGEWSVCEQHGLRLINENIPEQYVLGWAVGKCNSPRTTDYVALDIHEMGRLRKSNVQYKSTIVHELIHGCGVNHHGKENDVLENPAFPGQSRSAAFWNGINAGDIGCVMQYGWADWFYLQNGVLAASAFGYAIAFQNTTDQIKWDYLCTTKQGSGDLKSKQLGSAENGNCFEQVHISDK